MLDVSLHAALRGHQNQVFALEMGDEGTLFSAGNDRGVVEWDVATCSFRRILCAVSHSVYALHRIPGRPFLAIGLRSGEVMIVDYQTQSLVHKFRTDAGAVFSIKSLAKKNELVIIGEEGVAYVYDMERFERLYRFRVSDETVRTIAISEDESHMFFGDKKGVVYSYDTSDFRLIHHVAKHSMPVTSLFVQSEALYSGGRDAQLYLSSASTLETIETITPHLFTVYGIVKHPTEDIIATASRDKTWKVWTPSLTLLKNISIDRGYDSHHLSINTILWTERFLYTAGDDKVIRMWSVRL